MDYRLVRSKRKTLAIEVNNKLEVIVRAPLFVSKRRIEKFVLEHEKWVEKASEKIKKAIENRPAEPTPDEVRALKQKARDMIIMSYIKQLIGGNVMKKILLTIISIELSFNKYNIVSY